MLGKQIGHRQKSKPKQRIKNNRVKCSFGMFSIELASNDVELSDLQIRAVNTVDWFINNRLESVSKIIVKTNRASQGFPEDEDGLELEAIPKKDDPMVG